jgi:hypothetical protein
MGRPVVARAEHESRDPCEGACDQASWPFTREARTAIQGQRGAGNPEVNHSVTARSIGCTNDPG